MGAAESNGNEEKLDAQQILSQFNILKKFNDPRFGDSTLLEHKETKQQCVLRELNTTEIEEHKKGLEKYKQRLNLQHPNTVRLLKCFDKTDSQFCSTFYKTYLLFEFINNSLEKEILVRRPQQAFFQEGEIWNLMGGVIQGLAFLQKNDLPHGTIRAGTIYISEEDSTPKITDPTVFQQLNNFATVCSDKDQVQNSIYLSPALVDALEEGNWQPIHNEYKSDVFSFGITLLTMGLLEYCDECYNYSEYQFFPDKLQERIHEFSQRYSQDLTQFIILMLKTEEENRLDFIQLEEILISQPSHQSPDQYNKFSGNKQPSQQGSPNEQQEQQYSNQKSPIQETNELFEGHQQSQQHQHYEAPSFKQNSQHSQQSHDHGQHTSQTQHQQNSMSFQQKQQQQQQQQYQGNQQQSPESHKHGGVIHQQQTSPSVPVMSSNQSRQGRPAQFMARDESDSGTTKFNIPKDFTAQPSKPDENQGNELGVGTYRDDAEEDVQQQELANHSSQQHQLSSQNYQQSSYHHHQQQQEQNQDSGNKYQQNNYFIDSQQYKQTVTYDKKQPEQNSSYYNENNYSQNKNQDSVQKEMPKKVAGTAYATNTYKTYQQSSDQQSQTYQQSPDPKPQSYQPSGTSQTNNDNSYPQYKQDNVPSSTTYQAYNYAKGPNDEQVNSILQKYSPNKILNTSTQQQQQHQQQQQQQQHVSYQIPYVSQYTQQNESKKQQEFTSDYHISRTNQGQSQDSAEPKNSYQGYVPQSYQEKQSQEKQVETLTNQFSKLEQPTSYPGNTSSANYGQSHYQPSQQYQTSYSNSNLHEKKDQQQSSHQQPQSNDNYQQQSYNKYQQESSSSNLETVVENYQNGSRYEGQKYNNMRHGKGKFYYQDNGGLYDGEWKYNQMHGRGVLFYASGKPAYDGDWVGDKFEGFGQLFNEKPEQLTQPFNYKDFDLVDEYWTKYDGEFKDDFKEGYGTLYISNGEKFSGKFYRDFVHGTGTFYTQSGQSITGVWNNNKFQQQ